MFKKGFTLIELLVVIAIIGILSTVVLAFLGGARDKSKDASIKSQLSSLKTEVALRYDTTFGPSCGSSNGLPWSITTAPNGCRRDGAIFDTVVGTSELIDTTKMNELLNAIITNSTGAPTAIRAKVNSTSDQWAVAARLPSDASGLSWWCVDSSNVSKAVNIDNVTVLAPIDTSGTANARCN